MLLILEILAILFSLTLMFIGIWGFILMNRIFNQLRYKNYLMERVVDNLSTIAKFNKPSPKD
ncbi:MAG TPA: hypothetical protein VIK72_08545 [Clostridiaceae bacterium]